MKWKAKLTKAQLEHLKECKITTLAGIKSNTVFQDTLMFPCWECVGIARRLGLEVKLTAFVAKS